MRVTRLLAILAVLWLAILPASATMLVQQSVVRNIVFFMTDSADHITGKVSLVPTVTLSKNGAGFGAAAGAVTEIGGAGNGNGWYQLAATVVDTGTLGQLVIHATAAGADPADMLVEVVGFNPQVVAVGAAVAGDAMTLANGAIVAATFGAGAIDAAAVKDGAIDAATFAAGAIDAAAIKDAAIDNATFAADVGSTALATNPVAQAAGKGAWNSLTADHAVANSFGALVKLNLDATIGSRAAPGALMGLADNAITAAKIDAAAIGAAEAPALANLDAAVSSRAVAGDAMALVNGAVSAAAIATAAIDADAIAAAAIGASEAPNLDVALSSRSSHSAADVWSSPVRTLTASGDPSAATIADAVWDEAQGGHLGPGTFGLYLDAPVSGATAPTAGQVADAVWDEATAGHVAPGSFGDAVGDSAATLVKLDTTLELDGVVYRFTLNALEQAPGAVGATDWTPTQKTLILNTLSRILAQVGGG